MTAPKKRLGKNDVCQIIKERITRGDFSTDGLLPPLRSLATAIGCSRHTVWNAVNQLCEEQYLVSDDTGRNKVHPRFIFSGKDDELLRVAFVSKGNGYLEDPLEAKIFHYLTEHQEGLKISLSLSANPTEQLISFEDFSDCDAAIIATACPQNLQTQFQSKEITSVTLNPPLNLPQAASVRIDYFQYGELAGQEICNRQFSKLVVLKPAKHDSSIELYYLGVLKSWLRAGKLESDIKTITAEDDLFQRLTTFNNELRNIDSSHAFILFTAEFLPELHSVLDKQGQWNSQALIAMADDHPALDEFSISSIGSDTKALCSALIQQLRNKKEMKTDIIPGQVITRQQNNNLGSDSNA
ncbi:GntR family transcriptional regulator [Lentisphaera marina]|uniref:GntR family transcriptional regulator n=1 Tax=Lentisphaera marina TaxID=1111041 RepID=UPI0023655F4F|nr:GntR family transcriptional regulator [Lentisphaera marina]MDD7985271.1 GntR family transcriptional regulator [Lentisphaera marina]